MSAEMLKIVMRLSKFFLMAAWVAALSPWALAQEHTYSKGQAVQPAFEGWEQNEDGSYLLWFGYMNRNWEEELDVPVGEDNFLAPGPADQGQPTHFLPRRNRLSFAVEVPESFFEDESNRLIWTLRTQGEELRAFGSIEPDFFVDKIVIMSENGSIFNGATDPEVRANQWPEGELEGNTQHKVRVGEPVELSVRVSDDGQPGIFYSANRDRNFKPLDLEELKRGVSQPRYQVPGKVNFLHVSWFVYRGEGEVDFSPRQVKVWEDTRPYSSPWAHGYVAPLDPEDGRWTAQVRFQDPGTYVLHGRVSDGGLHRDIEVTVEVTPIDGPL